MCNGQNGHRHLGALHILYQQQPTDLDRRFIEIRQWLTAEGKYLDHSSFACLNTSMAQANLPSYSFVL